MQRLAGFVVRGEPLTDRNAMAAAAQGKTNWFAIGISIAVVVVLVVLGAVVVWLNNQATDAGPAPQGDIVNSETGAPPYGNGDTVIDTPDDFMCPPRRYSATLCSTPLQPRHMTSP